MVKFLVTLLVNSPFYPHWLDFKNQRKTNDRLFKRLYGKVLETGCGNLEKKERILSQNKNITHYVATDSSDWDMYFAMKKKQSSFLGPITEFIFGKIKDTKKIDSVCDAKKLPFKKSTFDCYVSFEVLEHIDDPNTFLSEAHRVLKPGGLCLITMPFLYREHGQEIMHDFQRFTRGGFYHLAQKTGFTIKRLDTDSYFGTTLAILINQYVIRKITESTFIVKFLLIPCAPGIFFLSNITGLIIDMLDKDIRFASHYHVLMEKTK